MEIQALHFIRPLWLYALPLAVVVPLAWRYFRRPAGDWGRVCDAHLLRWLSVGEQSGRRGIKGALAAGAVIAVTAVALAGPSWTRLPDGSYAARDARVLVLDLSRSMLAEDLKPNRLTQARYRLMDMLADTREGQVGLVAYAGDAYVVSPLTSDMNTIANLLPALQPDIIPVAGSRADRALLLAADLLRRAGAMRGEILLITDEADASDARRAALLAEQGIYTSVLAVGTAEGAPIPSGSGFVADGQGNVVITRLDLDSLVAVAEAGQGRFNQLDASGLVASPWQSEEGGAFARREDAIDQRWKDMGPWLVLLVLPFAALAFRRGLLFLMPLLVLPGLLVSAPAHAGWWEDLWQRPDQQAQRALANEQAERAAQLAQDPAIMGEALYRAGEYEDATQAWMRAGGAEAHYNRGNALALAGELEAAIAAYDQALSLRPGMEDALFNRAIVEQLKQQQEEQQGDDSGEGEQEEGEQGEGEQQEGEGEQQEGEQDSEGEEQEGESSQPGEQDLEASWSEEDAQAMEQWLRRIPDDPGGLLRRKFRSQHQQRGAPEDEEKDW